MTTEIRLGLSSWSREGSLWLLVAVASAVFGCGSSPAAPSSSVLYDSGPRTADGAATNPFPCSENCLDNRSCSARSICAFGTCRLACVAASDCPAGTLCLNDGTGGACLPRDAICLQGSCSSPLACASDHRCRNICLGALDCAAQGIAGRVCALDANGVGFCADPSDVSAGLLSADPPPGSPKAPVQPPAFAQDAGFAVVYRTNEGGAGPLPNDETTGIPCASDAICHNPNGPGRNECSSSFTVTFYGTAVQLWATPVCVIPPSPLGNCYPGLGAGDVHFCDGPNDPSSPGICIANDPRDPSAGGACVPKCTFANDGSPATGCVGHNACGYLTELFDVKKQGALGVGYCRSACETNADCADIGPDYTCEADTGQCTLVPVTRTKRLGEACTTVGSANDQALGACYCAAGPTGSGFCATTCIVGGAACVPGWTCETGEPSTLDFGSGAPVLAPLTTQTQGMLGTCVPTCTPSRGGELEGGSFDAGVPEASPATAPGTSPCPATSVCTVGTVAGPVCLE